MQLSTSSTYIVCGAVSEGEMIFFDMYAMCTFQVQVKERYVQAVSSHCTHRIRPVMRQKWAFSGGENSSVGQLLILAHCVPALKLVFPEHYL